MDDYGIGSGLAYGGTSQAPMEKMARTPNLQQRLDLAVKQAEERLAAVKEAQIGRAHV